MDLYGIMVFVLSFLLPSGRSDVIVFQQQLFHSYNRPLPLQFGLQPALIEVVQGNDNLLCNAMS